MQNAKCRMQKECRTAADSAGVSAFCILPSAWSGDVESRDRRGATHLDDETPRAGLITVDADIRIDGAVRQQAGQRRGIERAHWNRRRIAQLIEERGMNVHFAVAALEASLDLRLTHRGKHQLAAKSKGRPR